MLKMQERLNWNFVEFVHDGIYELKASHNGNIYRAFLSLMMEILLCCLMVFQKKTQKTSSSEIEKALKLKNEYYASKS